LRTFRPKGGPNAACGPGRPGRCDLARTTESLRVLIADGLGAENAGQLGVVRMGCHE